ncbi:MAG TPA: DHA2 family efflux MFS transporter permease subunit [Gammaproteobacteria bacterium]|nr:DHA2 family efflux MFS transporter permease subunit [Gammaproteobacteria bacterium]
MQTPMTAIVKANKNIPLFALCLGFFMVIIDVMVVNIALHSIGEDLKGSFSGLQWVVAGYTLTFASLLLSAGYLGDRVGAKPAFLWGLGLFVLTSLGCGLAPFLWLLVVFRLFQGASAALLVPTSLALINASYENLEDRAKAIGVWASVGGIAGAAGPVLGALLTHYLGWRSIFLINIPVGVAAILLTLKYVASPTAIQQKTSFDFLGQLLGIISVASLAFGLIEAGNSGWLAPLVLCGFVVCLLSFIAFIWHERRAIEPMFPLNFFKAKTFSVGIAAGMILNLGAYGLFFVLPFYFQQVRHYSVLMTGLALLPMLGLGVMTSFVSGRLIVALGPKLPMFLGLSMGALGFFALLITGESAPSYLALILPLVAIGVSALTMPAATVAVIRSVADDRVGVASGAFNTSRQVGSLLGVAIFGAIINTVTQFVWGMHVCLIIAGCLFLGGCAVIWGVLD